MTKVWTYFALKIRQRHKKRSDWWTPSEKIFS